MSSETSPSRRSFLLSSGGALGTAWLTAHWPAIAAAAHEAHASVGQPGTTLKFLTAAEAADVDAMGAQIVPTDDKPGAREAGAVYFIDRALADFFSANSADYRKGLSEFRAGYQKRWPAANSFAALDHAKQVEFLGSVEQTPFFGTTRLLTVLGLLSMPKYGGNRDLAGWQLLGFEDQHVFSPPFGYYDRDYPGFVPYPPKERG